MVGKTATIDDLKNADFWKIVIGTGAGLLFWTQEGERVGRLQEEFRKQPAVICTSNDGKMVGKHACVDGPKIDTHVIDWDKFLPRFGQFRKQESTFKHGYA